MNDNESKNRGFKVTDRRSQSENEENKQEKVTSEPKNEEKSPQKAPDAPQPGKSEPPDEVGKGHSHPHPDEKPGPINFSQFVLSLATSALIQMGEAKHPETGESFEDFGAAQQTIDILDILKAKTKGNLEPAEGKMLDNVLAELRFRFVNKVGKKR